MNFKRGDIVMADLGVGSGSEQSGKRPCLVVQNDKGNLHATTLIVCPITTKTKHFCVTHVDIECLKFPSVVLCEQIRTIDKARVTRTITTLDASMMLLVNKKMMISLEL